MSNRENHRGGNIAWRLLQRLRNYELWELFALFAIAGALWLFAAIASEVRDGNTRAFDRTALLALRDPTNPSDPIGPHWLEEVARDITSLGGTTVVTLLTIAVAGFLALTRRRSDALLVIASIAGGAVFSAVLKLGFDRPRPDLVPHAVDVYSSSFPSGHAMLSTITYLTLGALLARVQTQRRVKVYLLSWAVAITALVGASRVYLGVHWPTDVLAGWCVGSAWAMLCGSVALRMKSTRDKKIDC